MMNRPTTTALASRPMFFQRDIGSHPMAASCKRYSENTCNCKSIGFSLLRVDLLYCPEPAWPFAGLLAQREVHVDLSRYLNRFSVQSRRLIHPLSYRFESGGDQQRMAADHLEILNGA